MDQRLLFEKLFENGEYLRHALFAIDRLLMNYSYSFWESVGKRIY
jgi:hypothetical protein